MGTWINGQESKGPYGYLCLGLVYGWDCQEKILTLKSLILIEVDLKLRTDTELPLYFDRFESPVEKITEKNGRHYYKDCPILNYDMLEIPTQLNNVKEEFDSWTGENRKTFLNKGGKIKYSINRVCNTQNYFFDERYVERYACIIDFDEVSQQGCLIGFDCLGKIMRRKYNLSGVNNAQDIQRTILKDMTSFEITPGHLKYEKNYEERIIETGVINFTFSIDVNGKAIYEYNSVWDSYSRNSG